MAGLSVQTSIFDAPAQPEVRADAQAAPVAPKVKKQPAPAARKEPRQGDDGNVAMFSRSAGSTDTEAQRQFKETERAYGGKRPGICRLTSEMLTAVDSVLQPK